MGKENWISVDTPLREKIRKHFKEKGYDYRFEWGKKKEKWGAKYETISTLQRLFQCPKTSLYVPVKQLKEEGFLSYSDKLICYEEKIITLTP